MGEKEGGGVASSFPKRDSTSLEKVASSFRWGNTSSLTQEVTDNGEGGYS